MPKPLNAQPSNAGKIKTSYIEYHGWTNAVLIDNGIVEVIVVPIVGRVMQFRFAGESDGPFWELRTLDGKSPDPNSKEWGNFGGDKAWPSPQSEWPKITDRGWPPPRAFDSRSMQAKVLSDGVELESPIDPHYGIRIIRKIRLLRGSARMTIDTEFEKVSGKEMTVGVWTVTQLKDPERVFAPIPLNSIFESGYNNQGEKIPPTLDNRGGMLSLKREAVGSYKIGSDGGTLVWVGRSHVVRIDSPRMKDREYPDRGSSAEIYTNGDPNAYVELELLGPLESMRNGLRIRLRTGYTLYRRSQANPEAEARRVLLR